MAYVSTEMTKAVRAALKAKFKDYKFSVRKNAHCSTLYITILNSPVDLTADLHGRCYAEINHYHVENYKHADIYKSIFEEMFTATASVGREFYDDSDTQTDYFNCAYYYYLRVGDYDKPCVFGE